MDNTTWFEEVFGFPEVGGYEQVQSMFRITSKDDDSLILTTVPQQDHYDDNDDDNDDDDDEEEESTRSNKSRQFHVGKFDTPSVNDLRSILAIEETASPPSNSNDNDNQNNYTTISNKRSRGSFGVAKKNGLSFEHIVGSVDDLHRDSTNVGSVFQAASQFNCLEMISPNITPDYGITRYILDPTQGPTCAMTCPAGTVYRNYFVGKG